MPAICRVVVSDDQSIAAALGVARSTVEMWFSSNDKDVNAAKPKPPKPDSRVKLSEAAQFKAAEAGHAGFFVATKMPANNKLAGYHRHRRITQSGLNSPAPHQHSSTKSMLAGTRSGKLTEPSATRARDRVQPWPMG